ncbi:Gfo/Idh/MocA family protein [Pseudarthrobacter raffinosi]|uniref:Gfo/Idh/MocA family protein n=1 Tax=Pseudarthrobacter raffinosi TaxID=2953651 RepID=UPI00208F7D8A|nr:Gfo/Idh/MocA family oxidoreductase [Pseudarthrobacter sp. MDT3-9]MCO4250708.1 Gfo/Idh/MocA family oxidoreductase [Pseudarthrobacter sp. MDT3-9]
MVSDASASQSPACYPAVKVGLVGAGQWAATMHAPLHSAGAETELAGVWSASGSTAETLAAKHGVRAFGTFEELLASCEAVDFAVPPPVQAELAPRAADAGLALLLEKPLGASLQQAVAVADAVRRNKAANAVVLTKRYHQRTRSFLAEATELRSEAAVLGITGTYLHGGFLDGGFLNTGFPAGKASQGWRDELGVLYDLGPHLLDLMELAAGPIQAVRAEGSKDYVTLTTFHRDGATGQACLSGSVRLPRPRTALSVYSTAGSLDYTTEGMDHSECWPALRREFADAVRLGTPVTVDVERAVHVQALVEAVALSALEQRRVPLAEILPNA